MDTVFGVLLLHVFGFCLVPRPCRNLCFRIWLNSSVCLFFPVFGAFCEFMVHVMKFVCSRTVNSWFNWYAKSMEVQIITRNIFCFLHLQLSV